MCCKKSLLQFKDWVFCPEYDSHTDMLEELGIADTRENAERLFVRSEVVPPDSDVFAPIDRWKYRVDQDILPDWYVEEVDRERAVAAVKAWAKEHIHIGVDGLKISSGQDHYIKDCKDVEICGSANIGCVRGNATVKSIYNSATVENICDNATVKYICDNATVENICGNATVKYIYDNATVKNVKGYCTVIGSSYGWKNKDKMLLCDNATFKDLQTKTIWQAGDWTLKTVEVMK